ncbi:hypothetical protein EVA_11949, partial [gut metagenome]
MRLSAEAEALEGDQSFAIRGPEDLSMAGRLSPTTAAALAGRWGSPLEAPKLVRAVLAQTPSSLLPTDRSSLLAYLTHLETQATPTRSVERISLRCTLEPASAPSAAATVTPQMAALSAPGCRRFEVTSPESLSALFWSSTVSGYPADSHQPAVREGFLVRKRLVHEGRDLFTDPSTGKPRREARIALGDTITVAIDVTRDAGRPEAPVVLTDLLPGGFEPLPESQPAVQEGQLLSSLTADDRQIWHLKVPAT